MSSFSGGVIAVREASLLQVPFRAAHVNKVWSVHGLGQRSEIGSLILLPHKSAAN